MQAKNQEKQKPRSFVHARRYILVVDGQRKSSLDGAESAAREAEKLRQAHPTLKIEI